MSTSPIQVRSYPLTRMLVALMKAKPEAIARTTPEKLAARFGVGVDYAEGYLRLEKQQRGIRS